MLVSCSCADHDWGIVDLSVPRNVASGKIKACAKPSVPVRGCVLSEAFCAHYERRKPCKMPSTIQSRREESRISG